jgi:hypothetical protein
MRFETDAVFAAEAEGDDLLLSEALHPEFAGLSYTERIARLLDQAGERFWQRSCFHLAALSEMAADELRRSDSDDQFYRRLGAIGSGQSRPATSSVTDYSEIPIP